MILSSINPACLGSVAAFLLGIIMFTMSRKKQTLFVSIPAGVDPLDEGLDGWRGLAGRVRTERTKRIMIIWAVMAVLIMIVSFAWQPAQVVIAALQPTATATITPSPTITPTMTLTPTPESTPTPLVIYVIITPESTGAAP